jgi:hypothetical protein
MTARTSSDRAIALALGGLAVAYLVSLPRSLGASDEATYLYEAKRLLHGEVMYRDVFDFITPGWMYLMAAAFRVFGTDIRTARVVAALIHGVAIVLLYRTARALDVGRPLAAAAGIAYLVLCPPAWPVASQHWLSTALTLALLWACAARDRERRAFALVPGVILGVLVCTQQQRGVPMGVAMVGWLVLDHLVARRFAPRPVAALVRDVALFAAGALAVIVPVLGALTLRAGVGPIWRALVLFPFQNYGAVTRCRWGDVNVMTATVASYTAPRVLFWMPLVLVPILARLGLLLARGRDPVTARRLTLLASACGASALSVLYFPDVVHLAFIAPVFLLAAAESLACAGRTLVRDAAWRRLGGGALLVGVAIAGGARLQAIRTRLVAAYPIRHQTAFGPIDYATQDEVRLQESVQALLADVPGRRLFVYPGLGHLYLTADANNPTPYGFFVADFHRPDQVADVLQRLRDARLPWIVYYRIVPFHDAVAEYITTAYAPLDPSDPVGALIYVRRPDG